MARDREVAHQRLRRQLALRPRRQVDERERALVGQRPLARLVRLLVEPALAAALAAVVRVHAARALQQLLGEEEVARVGQVELEARLGRWGEMWGDVGRCGEMWGDVGSLKPASSPRFHVT